MIVWFDDLDLGTRYQGPEIKVTRDGIKRFAAEFDPQPFHLDEAEAGLLNCFTPQECANLQPKRRICCHLNGKCL
jgi:acyl dehydratase